MARARHRNTRRLADALWIAGAYLHNMADLCILGDYICVAVPLTSLSGSDSFPIRFQFPVPDEILALSFLHTHFSGPLASFVGKNFDTRQDACWGQLRNEAVCSPTCVQQQRGAGRSAGDLLVNEWYLPLF